MTNAEKYLKDGVDIFQFKKELASWIKYKACLNTEDAILSFLNQESRITLTEAERVILKNIKSNENYKTYIKICRTTYGSLYLIYNLNKEISKELGELETDFADFEMYNDLFQFIKNGEEYSIKELLNE